MKKGFLLLAISAVFSLASFAGVNQSRSGQRGSFQLPKELNLSAEQQQKIDAITTDFEAKTSQLRSNTNLTEQQRRDQMTSLRQEQRSEVNKVLTTEQQAQLAKMRSDRDAKGKRGDRGGRGSNSRDGKQRGGDWAEKLNLTETQKQQMKDLKEKYKNDSKEMSKEHRDAVNQILTPEQQALLQEARSDKSKSGRSATDGKRGSKDSKGKRNSGVKAQLDSLKQDYNQKKKAVEMSRIAPEAQAAKLQELEKQYKADVKQLKGNSGRRGTTK